MGFTQFDEHDAFWVSQRLDPSTIGTNYALLNAVNKITRVDAMLVTNTDTLSHDLEVYSSVGVTLRLLMTVTIPADAGTSAVPLVDILAMLPAGMGGQFLVPVGAGLAITPRQAMNAGKLMDVTLVVATF